MVFVVDPETAGQPAVSGACDHTYVAVPEAPQFAVNVTSSAGNGLTGDAVMLQVKDWHVRVKLDPLWVIPQDPQFGSLNVMVAGPIWP